MALRPTQYCGTARAHRYSVRPPVIGRAGPPDHAHRADAVAAAGWSVQVFDEHLEKQIGKVRVPKGKAVFDGITMSDVVPQAFYLVIVEDATRSARTCSGAWPVGFIRDARTCRPPRRPRRRPAAGLSLG